MIEKDNEVNKQNAFSLRIAFFLILEAFGIEQLQLVTDIKTHSLSPFTRTKKRHVVLTILLCVSLKFTACVIHTAEEKEKKELFLFPRPFRPRVENEMILSRGGLAGF